MVKFCQREKVVENISRMVGLLGLFPSYTFWLCVPWSRLSCSVAKGHDWMCQRRRSVPNWLDSGHGWLWYRGQRFWQWEHQWVIWEGVVDGRTSHQSMGGHRLLWVQYLYDLHFSPLSQRIFVIQCEGYRFVGMGFHFFFFFNCSQRLSSLFCLEQVGTGFCCLNIVLTSNPILFKAVLNLYGNLHTIKSPSCWSQWEFRLKLDQDLAHKAQQENLAVIIKLLRQIKCSSRCS